MISVIKGGAFVSRANTNNYLFGLFKLTFTGQKLAFALEFADSRKEFLLNTIFVVYTH